MVAAHRSRKTIASDPNITDALFEPILKEALVANYETEVVPVAARYRDPYIVENEPAKSGTLNRRSWKASPIASSRWFQNSG